ncbi:MAG: hypothetical protein R8M45_02510 [Ghiorsea sp.]
MKSTKYHWIAIACLSLIIVTGAMKFVVMGDTSASTGVDERTIVNLNANQRQMVLQEMRGLLETTQQVVQGLANNDLAQVAEASKAVGMAAVSTMDVKLKAKLPLGFKKLGFATHQAFDDLATMANNGAEKDLIQRKLADTMNNCLSCHATYQIPSFVTPQGE